MNRLVLASAAMALGVMPLVARAEKRDLDLRAADGTPLKATYYPAAGPGPGVVLLHMCNSQRKAWDKLAAMLSARGVHAISLDYRGYGESGGRPFDQLDDAGRRAARDAWPGDIDAAFDHLVAQPGVDRTRIGAAGGSCGVDNAVQLALRHPEVRTLALLAGGTNAAGQQFLARNPGMPLFGTAAHDDGNAVEIVRWLLGFSSHPATRLQEYERGGHGTDLFPIHAGLEPMLADWFVQHLVKEPAQPSAAGAKPGPSGLLAGELHAPGGGARLLARWREQGTAGAPLAMAPEAAINAAGYEHLAAGRAPDAIDLFTLNVEAFPRSLNAHDSLTEALVATGDRARALEAARRTLAAIAADTTTPDEFKQQLRRLAEERVRQLTAQ